MRSLWVVVDPPRNALSCNFVLEESAGFFDTEAEAQDWCDAEAESQRGICGGEADELIPFELKRGKPFE